jgi:predicted 3-demethylubiquinone-9 3-methyltransferase (glyoxalase superfamily)
MQKITPCLWFDNQGEDAMKFYGTVFKNAKIGGMNGVMGSFEIEGQKILVLNGGPHFKLSEAISLYINCKDQAEVDYYWEKLGEGGSFSQCGWLKDKFGLSWQIVPEALPRLLTNPDRPKAEKAMQAMLQMRKLDVAKLEAAFNG